MDNEEQRAREVLARWKAVLDAHANAGFLTSYTIEAAELRAILAALDLDSLSRSDGGGE